MNREHDRRLFLKAGSVMMAGALAVNADSASADEKDDPSPVPPNEPAVPTERMSVGIMGLNNRGTAIAKTLLSMGYVDITHICDVDTKVLDRVAPLIGQKQQRSPETLLDFRRMLDVGSLDAVFIAAPNHWHAPATIMACDAGKHVYVEKPCSHNPAEGEWAVQAARRNKVVVQTGTQRRSWPALMEGIEKIHQGELGDVLYARCWYNNRRAAIGHGKQADPPESLDWDLWQGPAPRQPFVDNIVPYNWHWHWHWGNGEIGNNGVHGIDVARWGMQLKYPTRVAAVGGKYRHDDDQETPDTMSVGFDYDNGKTITWEGLSWSPLGAHDTRFGISFHGTEGSMVMRSTGYTTFDMKGKAQSQVDGRADDQAHIEDFFECVRTGGRPRADIEIGHESALHCHLGNIAYRVGETLETNPETGHLIDNEKANAMWQRAYEPGWQPATSRDAS